MLKDIKLLKETYKKINRHKGKEKDRGLVPSPY